MWFSVPNALTGHDLDTRYHRMSFLLKPVGFEACPFGGFSV